MANEALDNLGRKIDATNMSIGELRALIASLMKNKVGKAKPIGGSGEKDSPIKKLVTLFEKYTKDFEKENKEHKKLLEEIKEGIKNTKSKGGGKKSEKKGTITERASSTLKDNLANEASDKSTKKNLLAAKIAWNNAKYTIKNIETSLLGFESFSSMFEGTLKDEREFTQKIRQAAYETAGVNKESESLQRSFESIGKTVKATGFDRREYQKEYINALKSGVKDQKKAMILTTTQLNTEKQIGAAAGDLGETFIKFNNELKLTNDQTADVGRGIREVGRNTGLVGKELAAVVSSSQQFVDQMRKAGTATASSIKNVIGLQAEFKKLGITDTAGKLLAAISSTTGFYEAGVETQSLLANAASRVGLSMDMTTGAIIKSNEKLKLLNKGLVQTANNLGLGGSNVEEMRKNFESLSDEAKRAINLRFKGAFGMEAGEVLGTIEAFENKTKTLSEKLADLNKEKAKNLTLEEKTTLAEKERSLKLSAGLGALTALSEAAKDVTNMDQALAKFGKRRSEFEGDIKALGGAWSSETDAARTAIQSSVNALNEGLKKAGKKGLSIDSGRIEKALRDPATLRELTAEITKGEQELATAQKAQADPLTSMDQTLKEINDGIRNMSQGIISAIFNSLLGKVLIGILTAIGFLTGGIALLGSFASRIGDIISLFDRIISLFSGSSMSMGGGIQKVFDKVKSSLGLGSKKEAATAAQNAKETQRNTGEVVDANHAMLNVLKEIRDCICSKTTEGLKDSISFPESSEAKAARKGYLGATKLKGVSAAEKEATGRAAWDKMKAEGLDPNVERARRKQLEKQQKNQRKEDVLLKQQQKNTKQQTRNIRQETNIVKQEVAAPTVENLSESGFDINKLISSGKDMGKAALAVTILGLGAVALGSAIVFVAKGILSAFNLDMKTIIEVAGAVAALAAAGGAIVGAGYIAYEALMKNKEAQEGEEVAKELNTKLIKQVAIISLLGPALVLLGAVIVKAAQLITQAFGLDMGTVAEVAGSVVAIVVAAGALIAGAATAFEGLEKLDENVLFKKLMENPWNSAIKLGKAALVLLALAPALVLLASAIIRFSQLAASLFGLDMSTAAKIAGDVGAVIAAAGFIALAVIGASAGLAALGLLVESGLLEAASEFMFAGAIGLMLLAPAITILAAGLVTIIRGILGVFGIDAGVAAKAAWNIGVLLTATGAIAFAVMAAMAGLAGLGAVMAWLIGPQAGFAIGFMILGAAALLLLTPAIIGLAAVVVDLARAVMAVLIDPDKATLAAENVGKIIGAAASIALNVLGAMAGLTILGASIPILFVATRLMFLGTLALLALTPAVIGLATSIIYMAEGVLKRIIDPKEAKEIVEALDAVLGAASDIAWSILSMAASLSALAALAPVAPAIALFMLIGATALRIISWPIVSFINVIKDFYESISFVDPKDAVRMGEETASIFNSVGIVADNILKTRNALLSLVGANNWGWFGSASEGMKQGANAIKALMLPVLSFVFSIKSFYNIISAIVDPKKASEMGQGIASILCAVGRVVNGILGVKKGLIGLRGAAGGFFSWLTGDPINQMYEGSNALEKLKAPVKDFIQKTVNFYRELSSIINPEEASKMGDGVANILNAVGNVVRGILWVKQGMIGLKGAAGGGWFSWLTGNDVVSQMAEGSKALNKLKEPVKGFIKSTVDFYKEIASIMSPEKASEAGNGVGNILGAVGFVTSKIICAKEALVALSKVGGWRGIENVVSQMSQGTESLDKLMWPVIDYALKIQFFSNMLQSMFGSTEEVAKSANGVANILRAVGFTTWHILASAKMLASVNSRKLSSALSNSLKIINEGMIAPIRKNLAATSELEEALHQLDLVLEIAEKMNDISEICKGLSPVSLGSPIEGKLASGGMGGTTSDKAISQRNESKQADTLQDSTKILSEFVETSLRGKGIIVRTSRAAGVSAVPPIGDVGANSIQARVQRDKVSKSTNKSEVTSSELSEIADNTEQQNIILQKMEKLLEKFVDLAKPPSEVAKSGGGSQEPPQNNSVAGKPTNYYRRTIGNVNNTPSKAIVNVGAKAIS